MSLLSWQAVKHQGHLPFAAMMGSFVLVPHIESVVRQLFGWLEDRAAEQHPSPDGQRSMGSIAVALMLFVVLSCAQFPRQATLNVNRDYHAVSAMPFMADNRLEGNVLVTFNGAQYALAVFADSSPESRIAFDGWFRTCYPQPIIDMYFDFILGDLPQHVRYREASSGPFDAKKALEYKNPDLVLIECERKNSVRTMEACSGGMVSALSGQSGTTVGSSQYLRRSAVGTLPARASSPPQQRSAARSRRMAGLSQDGTARPPNRADARGTPVPLCDSESWIVSVIR